MTCKSVLYLTGRFNSSYRYRYRTHSPHTHARMGKGSGKDFCRSLKGRSASQTASTRVQELGIRYMRPFGTSLGHFYSYGTQVGMSILFHLIGRHEQIMPSSDQARSTGRPCHHMQLTNTCRGRILRKDQATKHACTLRTTSMRSAQSWAVARMYLPRSNA